MLYMVTFTINIPPMLAYIPYMDPMGIVSSFDHGFLFFCNWHQVTESYTDLYSRYPTAMASPKFS